MTAIGILQILVLLRRHPRVDQAARRLHGAGVRRASARSCTRCCGRSSGCIYRLERHPGGRRAALDPVRGRAARVQHRKFVFTYLHPAAAGLPAAEPAGLQHRARAPRRDADDARPRVQHRRQLHDQHELAVLRRRDDDELLRADGGADRAELHVRRRRHRHRHRARPRLRAAARRRRSATSGWT